MSAGKAHSPGMNTRIRMSTRGRVLVPKKVRDRLGWREGLQLDVVEFEDGVELRARPSRADEVPPANIHD